MWSSDFNDTVTFFVEFKHMTVEQQQCQNIFVYKSVTINLSPWATSKPLYFGIALRLNLILRLIFLPVQESICCCIYAQQLLRWLAVNTEHLCSASFSSSIAISLCLSWMFLYWCCITFDTNGKYRKSPLGDMRFILCYSIMEEKLGSIIARGLGNWK